MPEFKVATRREISPGRGRTIRVDGRQIALFNVGGEFLAIDDACPHMRADLSCGTLEGRTVICAWHGWQFDLETGRGVNIERARVRTYPVRLDGEAIHVTLEPDPEPQEPDEEPFPEIVWKERSE